MNKQFLVTAVILFISVLLLDFLVHGLLLKHDYAALPALMRAEADAQRHAPAMLLAYVFFAVGFTAIYRRGCEAGRDWPGQGLRFGLWFAVASGVPTFLIYYAVQPIGLSLVVKQIVLGSVECVLLGLAVAAMNRPAIPAKA